MRFAFLTSLGILTAFSQTPKPQFEAASIKMTAPSGGGGHVHEHDTPGMLRASMTLKSYIKSAYEVAEVDGGPGWLDDTTYEIVAKLENARAGMTGKENDLALRAALQPLLVDRFHLKFHRETKETPGYAITVAKRGFKLEPAPAGEGCGSNSNGSGRVVTLNVKCIDMPEFADVLARITRMPVSDQTGVKGAYTFGFQWTPDDLKASDSGDRPPLPSLFTVMEEQLGLKLEQRKIPVAVLVVDNAERPTEN